MKYLKLFTIVAVMSLLASCTDWLSIEPDGKVVSDDYWKLESDVEAVVATCYRAFVEDGLNSDGSLRSDVVLNRMIVYGELRSDNMIMGYSTNTDLKKIIEANILPTNPYSNWSGFYKIINYCNLVLAKAPDAFKIDPNFTQSQLNAKMAEVLTLRALAYFYLVRTFGEVPLITEASLTDRQDYNIAKSSENGVLDQLEADLIKAEGWALSRFGSTASNKGRITKTAVRALLADIYLWRNKYAECVSYCDKVIQDPTLKLIEADDEPYFRIFGMKNSTESIFEFQFSAANNNPNRVINQFYGSSDDPFGLFVVPEIFAATTENEIFVNSPKITDVRRKDYITDKSANNIYSIFKYAGLDRMENSEGTKSTYSYRYYNSNPANWIVYRLTDVMLMKAEALVQMQQFAPAIHLVNTTYMRSNPTLTDTLSLAEFSDKDKMEKLVLLERQRELLFEGKRWFDLMRMARRDGKTNRIVDIVVRKLTQDQSLVKSKMKVMDALYFPISENELAANPNLKQNPYYESKFK